MSEFIDEAMVNLRGGDGGAGMVSFRREPYVERGGPDGGDGGRGGDVWLRADRGTASLIAFRDHPHRRAASGVHGAAKGRTGAAGADMIVPVPEGTMVKDRRGTVLADLVGTGDSFLAARGGRAGKGNTRFLSNSRRAPSFAEQGEYGEERWTVLELKLLADAALVGFPNAGKSTLIAAISAAKPKIADYPFTTLVPNLGVVRTDEWDYVVADIPGLIEGASEGRGLGHRFLRHTERARVLVLLLDLAPVDGRSPGDQARILLDELGRYRPELLERPRLVVGSKADVATPDFADFAGLRISAVTREGLVPFVGQLGELVAGARSAEGEPESFVVHRPAEEGFSVSRADDGSWLVAGRAAERVVAMTDLTNPEAMAYVAARLRTIGVERALARAGAREGDTVRLGAVELTYTDESYTGEPEPPRPHRRRPR